MKKSLLNGALVVMLASSSIGFFGCGNDKQPAANTSSSQVSSSTNPSVKQAEEKAAQEKIEAEKKAQAEAEAKRKADEAARAEQQKIPHIYDKAQTVMVKNGTGTKILGKMSLLKIRSDELTDEALEDWYFNFAKNKVNVEKYMWAVIVYVDKQSFGTFYNGVLVRDTKLKEEKDGTWSLVESGGTILVEDSDNPGKLKEF